MNIYTDNSQIEKNKNTIITIGTFDGVHRGHRNILNLVVEKAKSFNGRSLVITFDPHPRTVVSKTADIGLLTGLDEKIEIFDEIGIENLLVVKFTKEFSQLSYEEFIEDWLIKKVGVKHIVIGYDHKFGKNRGGDEIKLRSSGNKFGFDVSTVSSISIGDETISSTKIRNSLLEGDLEKANNYLGRNYLISGKIVEGANRGKLIGFPTANINPDQKEKIVPKKGVYVVSAILDSTNYFGVMNIGVRPTFDNSQITVIEVHIFDFNRSIYGEKIKVKFLKRIRDEKKFESKEELIEQIKKDKKESIDFISTLVN